MTRTRIQNNMKEGYFKLSLLEKLVATVATVCIGAILINSCWSIYLLHTGMTGGGGPLGLLVNTVLSLFGR